MGAAKSPPRRTSSGLPQVQESQLGQTLQVQEDSKEECWSGGSSKIGWSLSVRFAQFPDRRLRLAHPSAPWEVLSPLGRSHGLLNPVPFCGLPAACLCCYQKASARFSGRRLDCYNVRTKVNSLCTYISEPWPLQVFRAPAPLLKQRGRCVFRLCELGR